MLDEQDFIGPALSALPIEHLDALESNSCSCVKRGDCSFEFCACLETYMFLRSLFSYPYGLEKSAQFLYKYFCVFGACEASLIHWLQSPQANSLFFLAIPWKWAELYKYIYPFLNQQ